VIFFAISFAVALSSLQKQHSSLLSLNLSERTSVGPSPSLRSVFFSTKRMHGAVGNHESTSISSSSSMQNSSSSSSSSSKDDDQKGAKSPVPKKRRLKFRNYGPADPRLKDAAGDAQGVQAEGNVNVRLVEYGESAVRALENRVRNIVDKVDEINVTPRKINWDLKRDASKNLKKLARRTQRAILELAEEEKKRRQQKEEESESEESEDEEEENDSSE